jgi:LPS export ABC transporter protein LptC
MGKHKRLILLAAIFFSLGGVAYKVAESLWVMKAREFKKDPLKVLDYVPESALYVKDFHRAKIENGRKVWELFGDEARYFKEQKEAVIKNPKFYFYDKNGETAHTTGATARVYLNDRELEKLQLEGDIQVSYQGYLLKSPTAIYHPERQQIIFPQKATLLGEGIELEGSRMEVELVEKRVRLLRDVKTKLEPEKLAEKDKSSKRHKAIGG